MAREFDQRIYEVGQRIRQIRIEKGMSQTDLALAMDSDKSVVSKWELGNKALRLDTLYRLSDILEVTPVSIIQDMDPLQKEEVNLQNEISSLPIEQKQFILRTIRTLLNGLKMESKEYLKWLLVLERLSLL